MNIFIGNLPVPDGDTDADALVSELRTLLGTCASKVELSVFTKHPPRGAVYCFAVVNATSRRVGARVLQQLAGRRLREEYLLVARAFLPRAASQDRRAIDWRTREWQGAERRRAERRCFKDRHVAGWQAEQRPERRWSAALPSRLRGWSWRRLLPTRRRR